jgi:hypothetical protein
VCNTAVTSTPWVLSQMGNIVRLYLGRHIANHHLVTACND